MPTLYNNQAVKYVTSTGAIVDGTITECFPPDMAHVQWGEKHIALARYSEGKEHNTFHFTDESEDRRPEAPPTRPKPFKPGSKAVPDKPKTNGAPAPATT